VHEPQTLLGGVGGGDDGVGAAVGDGIGIGVSVGRIEGEAVGKLVGGLMVGILVGAAVGSIKLQNGSKQAPAAALAHHCTYAACSHHACEPQSPTGTHAPACVGTGVGVMVDGTVGEGVVGKAVGAMVGTSVGDTDGRLSPPTSASMQLRKISPDHSVGQTRKGKLGLLQNFQKSSSAPFSCASFGRHMCGVCQIQEKTAFLHSKSAGS